MKRNQNQKVKMMRSDLNLKKICLLRKNDESFDMQLLVETGRSKFGMHSL